jgi:hypothetical protein
LRVGGDRRERRPGGHAKGEPDCEKYSVHDSLPAAAGSKN